MGLSLLSEFESKIRSQSTYSKSDQYHFMLKTQQTSSDLGMVDRTRQGLSLATDDWKTVLARDATRDGTFVFGVRSTGIYCKPSCPARHPRLEQVVFFSGPDEAERSGFRACKRCRPRERTGSARTELVQRVCRYIDNNLDEKLTLTNLSKIAGLSPFYFQRLFRKTLGISPRQYIETRRLDKVRRSLRNGETVTEALYGAGFSSRGRLYEKSPGQLGVNPGTFRRGGEGLSIRYTIVDSPIGRLLLGATGNGICAVCIGASDQAVEAALREDYYAADLFRNDQQMKPWAEEFSRYFRGEQFPKDLPIDVQATAFQWKVWDQIQRIPYGQTLSYSQIAVAVGNPRAVRAVANACASNHVALLIPCHRVVGKKGDLRGYRWGVKRKQTLLSLEAQS
jgi:AraC family transcriptional regulator, regulatory protein of adaptative response / methylated-DNA-[protein]-cysteine methyltransferase